jgi:hypothetical protein
MVRLKHIRLLEDKKKKDILLQSHERPQDVVTPANAV